MGVPAKAPGVPGPQLGEGPGLFQASSGSRYDNAALSCRCCGGTDFSYVVRQVRSIYSSKAFDVVACKDCGHGITVPAPTPEELQSIYDRVYLYDVHYEIMSEKAYHARFLADDICRLKPAGAPIKVLEIGCMFGSLLRDLSKRGAIAKGIELSKEPVKYCQESGLDVSCESAEQFVARAPTRRFDAIVLSHVLEHLTDPGEIILRLKEILCDDGRLVICVPNYRCFHARWTGRYWGWWQVPVHVNHFCETSALRFFESLGLKVDSMRLHGGDSLTLLLTVMNALGAGGSGGGALTPLKRAVVRGLSWTLAATTGSVQTSLWHFVHSSNNRIAGEQTGSRPYRPQNEHHVLIESYRGDNDSDPRELTTPCIS